MINLLQKTSILEGTSGNWRIERFTVSKQDASFECLRAAIGGSARWIEAGEYTRLVRNDTTVMSDTPAELNDHYEPVRKARGDVLIHGLGLGIVAEACLRKPEVNHVTVIELSPDVINLVGPYLKEKYSDKLTIIQANSFEWKPPKGKRYNMVWFDIWDDLCSDNLPEMTTLHRRYGRRCDWQGSWGKEEIKYHKQRFGW